MNNKASVNESKEKQNFNIDNLKQLSVIKNQGGFSESLNKVRRARQEVDKVLHSAQNRYDEIIKKAQAAAQAAADAIAAAAQAQAEVIKASQPQKTETSEVKSVIQNTEIQNKPAQVTENVKEAVTEKPSTQVETKPAIENRQFNQDRPQGNNYRPENRPQGDNRRPYTPNPNNASQPQRQFDNRPRTDSTVAPRPFTPRPYGDRPQGQQGQSSFRPQGSYPQSNGQQGPRPFTPRPYGDRPTGVQSPRPYDNRPQGAGTGAPRPFTPRPYGDRPQGSFVPGRNTQTRTFGTGAPRPFTPRPYRPAGGGAEPLISSSELKTERTFANKKKVTTDHSVEDKKTNKRVLLRMGLLEEVVGDEERVSGRRMRPSKIKKEHVQIIQPPVDHAIITTKNLTVKILSEKIGKPVAEIIKKFMLLNMMVTINTVIDFDAASLIANEFKITIEQKLDKSFEEKLVDTQTESDDNDENMLPRPPVVTVMGHVDHGKTSLLDAIRSTHVAEGEAGGITQHIGAYTIKVNDRVITFIDTPGHEAFTAMRARGAQATDVAILVVAADDGVMPQTIEAISHIKAAKVPMIVAINKIDKPGADIERIKQQLTEHEVLAEEWGGDTIMVPISAKQNLNIDKLLETVLLVADMQELRANPNRKATGTVIESRLDKAGGPVATVLVQNGTLKVGDTVVAGVSTGRIRALIDDKGQKIKSAGPSMPVSIFGLDSVPAAGDTVCAIDEKLSRQVIQERKNKVMTDMISQGPGVPTTIEDMQKRVDESKLKVVNLIIKADVQGSIEALKNSLVALSNSEVKVDCVHTAVGTINESDILLAGASDAVVIGFNVKPDSGAKNLADRTGVQIRLYQIIYDAVDAVQNAVLGLKEKVYTEKLIGRAEVRAVFKISSIGVIAGSYVLDGKLTRGAKAVIYRNNVKLAEDKIESLKIIKDEKKEVAAGFECGIKFDKFTEIKEGDTVEAYIMEEVK